MKKKDNKMFNIPVDEYRRQASIGSKAEHPPKCPPIHEGETLDPAARGLRKIMIDPGLRVTVKEAFKDIF